MLTGIHSEKCCRYTPALPKPKRKKENGCTLARNAFLLVGSVCSMCVLRITGLNEAQCSLTEPERRQIWLFTSFPCCHPLSSRSSGVTSALLCFGCQVWHLDLQSLSLPCDSRGCWALSRDLRPGWKFRRRVYSGSCGNRSSLSGWRWAFSSGEGLAMRRSAECSG